jgi:pentatricopeptide repeat protein
MYHFIGYGKQKNEIMMTKTLLLCLSLQLLPDTILFNSVLDGYIRCNDANLALYLFESIMMKNSKSDSFLQPVDNKDIEKIILYFQYYRISANIRTFNIIFKGIYIILLLLT